MIEITRLHFIEIMHDENTITEQNRADQFLTNPLPLTLPPSMSQQL